MGRSWIQTIVNYFEDSSCRFISAPVGLTQDDHLFYMYQQLELLSLVSTSGNNRFK